MQMHHHQMLLAQARGGGQAPMGQGVEQSFKMHPQAIAMQTQMQRQMLMMRQQQMAGGGDLSTVAGTQPNVPKPAVPVEPPKPREKKLLFTLIKETGEAKPEASASRQRARDAATRARQVLGSETQAEVHQRGRQVRAHTREATRREISQKLTGQQKERAQRLPRLVQRTVARTTSPASTQYVAGARLMQVLLPHLDLGDRSLRGKGRAGAGIEPRQQNKRQLQPWARSRSPWRTSCRLRTRLLVLLRAQVRERS
jgi:hypothetical protein